MRNDTLLSILADFTANLKYEDLPPKVISKANDVIFDFIGCYYGALADFNNKKILRFAIEHSAGKDSSLWGTGKRLSSDEAALAMGYCGYSLEYDDGVSLAGHWGSSSIPAIFSVAEKYKASEKDIIAAVVCAYEVGTRISRIYSKSMLEHKIHFPGAMGFYAAAAGVAKIMKLNSEQIAKGLANGGLASISPYSTAVSGARIKSMYSGWPNFLGIRLMELACTDVGGDIDVFESVDGLGVVLSGQPLSDEKRANVLANLGKEYMLLQSYFKPYPCCRWLHAPLYLLEKILAENSNKNIMQIIVRGPKFINLYNTRGDYSQTVKAQYSIPYTLAAMLLHHRCGIEEFSDTFRTSAAIRKTADMIKIAEDDEAEKLFPERFQITLAVRFDDGSYVEKTGGLPWGPDLPATKDELILKFKRLTTAILGCRNGEAIVKLYKSGFEIAGAFRQLVRILNRKVIDI